MILFATALLFNTDFGDEFGDDATPPVDGPGFHMDPVYLLGGAVLIGIVVGVIAAVMYLAKHRAERRVRSDCEGSAKAIYDAVKWSLDDALRAPGSAILDRGREVADVLEARLGAVLALDGRAGKPFGDLAKALKGDKPPAKVEGPAKVKVARSTEDHAYQVWNALQALNAFWSDRTTVMTLLVAAQRELVTMPAPLPQTPPLRLGAAVAGKTEAAKPKKAQSLWDEIPDPRREKPKKVKAARPIVMPKPAPDTKADAKLDKKPDGPPDPPPPPPAPPPSGGRKKPLPAHKRNMLA